MTSRRERIFVINENEVIHILCPEDSDEEDNIVLDENNIIILEQNADEMDCEVLLQSSSSPVQLTVPEGCSSGSEACNRKGMKRKATSVNAVENISTKAQRIDHDVVADAMKNGKKNEPRLRWSKDFTPIEQEESRYPFGDVKAKFDDVELTPYNVILETIYFSELSAIILEQTHIYTSLLG
ncbi:uncharacterized protein LOC129799583 [Phlebotomus papatasi]|uniref:uncharacterized protein LOC129799583 n=1 Tax=Phlebotomus papatasi TaxID=29031 RepID=UPI0024846DBA|nr:uncharacterized protein LOC129799583 [Phlebotomus papatasi]